MNKNLIIHENATILDAMKAIDANQKGFVVVVDGDMKLRSVMTDGDIRRAIITGYEITANILSLPTKDYVSIEIGSDIKSLVKIFADSKYEFIPVVDAENRLVNIITESQLKVALLRNVELDLRFNFDELDENELSHSIVAKPWGYYQTTVLNDCYQSKVLTIEPQKGISLQLHTFREEYWMVVNGFGEAQIGDSKKAVAAGTTIFVPKNCKHRLTNLSDSETLVVVEVQLGESFDENDIERFEDDCILEVKYE